MIDRHRRNAMKRLYDCLIHCRKEEEFKAGNCLIKEVECGK